MPQRVPFTKRTISAFIFLGIIWGTFPLVIHCAIRFICGRDSPALIFVFRTPGAVVLYVGSFVFLSLGSTNNRELLLNNFKIARNYWMFAVMGLIQLALPYILFTYGLKVLSLTTGGVFITSVPLFSIVLERLPFVQSTYMYSISKCKLAAVLSIALAGITMVSAVGMNLAQDCGSYCDQREEKPEEDTSPEVALRNSNLRNLQTNLLRTVQRSCTPFSVMELTGSLLALIAGSISWSISSVFWHSNRGNIHSVSGGIGSNIFGGMFGLALFFVIHHGDCKINWNWSDPKSIFYCILFLVVMSDWPISFASDFIRREIGAVVVNQALCLVPLIALSEDWLFVRRLEAVSALPYTSIIMEVVGVVFVVGAVAISTVEFTCNNRESAIRSPLLSELSMQKMTDQLLRFTFLLALIQGPITLALHPSTENNHILVGYAFKQFFSRDWLNCIQACHDESRCISYNYERSAGADGLCELNHCGVEELSYRDRLLIYSSGFVYQQIRRRKHCLLKSCQELKQKYPAAKSGIHTIDPLQKARPIEVFCEFDIKGGGFTFLPHSVTNRSDGMEIVDALFKDRKNVLLKLKKKGEGKESYTLIQPHPNYTNIDFSVLVNNYSGYTQPKNDFMKEYIFLGILPKSVANQKTHQGFKSNGGIVQFKNCDGNPNSLFAFMPNREHQNPSNYHPDRAYEERGVAVDWRKNAKNITNPEHTMPQTFFFLTELHFGGCGCYTSSDHWSKYGFNATAIGIR